MSGGYAVGVPLLRTRFAAQWATLRPQVPVLMPNSDRSFDGTVFEVPHAVPHARLSFLSDAPTEAIAAGAESPARLYGRVLLEIFVPTLAGDLIGYQIADSFATIWEGQPVAGFLFGKTQVIPTGRVSDDPSRWKYDAMTPFEYEFS